MDKLCLYYGDNLKIGDITVKHPTLMEIKELGYDKYSKYVSLLSVSPVSIADILFYDSGLWYEDVTSWQLFTNICQTEPEALKALNWFLSSNLKLLQDKEDITYFHCKEDKIYINEITYNIIVDFIKDINFIPSYKQKKYNSEDLESMLLLSGNRRAKETILKQLKNRRKRPQEKNIDLTSIISSVDWKGSRGNEIWDYPVYRIYEGYMRLNAIDNYDKTMVAYYSGNIDTSKNSLKFDQINWSNIIKI